MLEVCWKRAGSLLEVCWKCVGSLLEVLLGKVFEKVFGSMFGCLLENSLIVFWFVFLVFVRFCFEVCFEGFPGATCIDTAVSLSGAWPSWWATASKCLLVFQILGCSKLYAMSICSMFVSHSYGITLRGGFRAELLN